MTEPAVEAPTGPASQGAARFVAFSAIDGLPWEADPSAAALLERVRSLSALGIGLTRCTEILDCGADGDEVMGEGMPLDEARRRFRTVFRGEACGSGLDAVDLISENGGAGVRLRKSAATAAGEARAGGDERA